jgi:hypothetical protein
MKIKLPQLLIHIPLLGAFFLIVVVGPNASSASETVEGFACYSYGDQETPQQGSQKAMILARRSAVESYRVFVKSESSVKDFQLVEDVIMEASSGMLSHVKILKREENGRNLCLTISANIDPEPMEALIKQKIEAKKIVEDGQSDALNPPSFFGLKVWTNNPTGRYSEGESLVISVESDRSGYLYLDYFQADSTVVHLVPNLFRAQARIEEGITFTFGADDSPEKFIVTGPFGHEMIRAMVSPTPLKVSQKGSSLVTESRSYLETLKGSRGISVQANASVTLVTSSKAAQQFSTIEQEK